MTEDIYQEPGPYRSIPAYQDEEQAVDAAQTAWGPVLPDTAYFLCRLCGERETSMDKLFCGRCWVADVPRYWQMDVWRVWDEYERGLLSVAELIVEQDRIVREVRDRQ